MWSLIGTPLEIFRVADYHQYQIGGDVPNAGAGRRPGG
jgi:hypothetical protein